MQRAFSFRSFSAYSENIIFGMESIPFFSLFSSSFWLPFHNGKCWISMITLVQAPVSWQQLKTISLRYRHNRNEFYYIFGLFSTRSIHQTRYRCPNKWLENIHTIFIQWTTIVEFQHLRQWKKMKKKKWKKKLYLTNRKWRTVDATTNSCFWQSFISSSNKINKKINPNDRLSFDGKLQTSKYVEPVKWMKTKSFRLKFGRKFVIMEFKGRWTYFRRIWELFLPCVRLNFLFFFGKICRKRGKLSLDFRTCCSIRIRLRFYCALAYGMQLHEHSVAPIIDI